MEIDTEVFRFYLSTIKMSVHTVGLCPPLRVHLDKQNPINRNDDHE